MYNVNPQADSDKHQANKNNRHSNTLDSNVIMFLKDLPMFHYPKSVRAVNKLIAELIVLT